MQPRVVYELSSGTVHEPDRDSLSEKQPMNREPDWESLNNVNFLIHRRMTEHLNAALAAISLIGAEEDDKPPEFWQERAMSEVLRSLNLHNAWASLIRHKLGEHFLPQHMLQFKASDLLRWLATELQLSHFENLPDDIILFGNRETLQEALLLLHSCSTTLGPRVRVQAEPKGSGMWFRVRYDAVKNSPPTLDRLFAALEKRPDSWRALSALFELRRARDFLRMNESELHYTLGQGYCEFAFFVNSAGEAEAATLQSQHMTTTLLTSGQDITDTVIAVDNP